MVEAKTIGITALILSGLVSAGVIGSFIDTDKPMYYCETRTDLGFKTCDFLSKYGVDFAKCNVDNTYFICKSGWVKVVEDRQINTIETETGHPLQYSCDHSECRKIEQQQQ